MAESTRAYIATAMEAGHMLYGTQPGLTSWEKLDHTTLLSILRTLMVKLSKLHASGYEAGDTSHKNIFVSKTGEPSFISMGHISVLDKHTHGLPETLSLLASFSHDLSVPELRDLLLAYLDAEPHAKARGESYLHHIHSVSRRTKGKPYAPHTSTVDRLITRVEDLVDALAYGK